MRCAAIGREDGCRAMVRRTAAPSNDSDSEGKRAAVGERGSRTRRTASRARSRARSKSTLPARGRAKIPGLGLTVPSPIPARVYKRWIFVSVMVTLLVSWLSFPYWLDTDMVPAKLGKLSEYLFESALFKLLPDGGLFKDDFLGNITSILGPFWKSEYESLESPGRILRTRGAAARYPVLLIPGITSTGLELWEGHECAQSYFRQRLWGTLTMMRVMVLDSVCWLQHLKLNATTGSDPAHIKLRPAQGLEAADFILPGFWVWGRMIENFAELGYDHNNLVMAAYDWRLDIINLEARDHYFSRLKAQIELLVKTRGEKIVSVSHSLGALVWLYFLKWVESDLSGGDNPGGVVGGRGGRDWVERHVHATVSIGAPHLGVPKAISMIISGEMRDTAQMGKLESFLLEMLMSKRERLSLFRTWPGGFAMLPKGGDLFWGNGTAGTLVDLEEEEGSRLGYGLVHLGEEDAAKMELKPMYTTRDVDGLLDQFIPPGIRERIRLAYSNSSTGIASPAQARQNERDPTSWTNPLQVPLPRAPSMKMYCLYGFGKDTERGYEYESVPPGQWGPMSSPETLTAEEIAELQSSDDVDKLLIRIKLRLEAENLDRRLYKGIYHVDGDGTVPTLSNGFMCTWGWRKWRHLNPANLTTIVREYRDEPASRLGTIRGGPKTGEHVDILGNHELTMDILKIVSGFEEGEEAVADRIESNILKMVERLDLPSF